MANWAKLQEDTIGLPVFKRAKHGIHFKQADGQVLANFTGKPCHYLDGGLWKPIDTKLLLGGDGFYGCPHSPVRISKEGRVKVDGTDYQQYTELPSATGLVDNDRIVRTFSFGEQRMWVTEDGYRSEIQLNRIPTLAEARKVITSQSGKLSKQYLKSLTTATDANGAVHTVTTLSAFRTWLASAKFPVVIDPDFGGDAADGMIAGLNADYATARATSDYYTNDIQGIRVGQDTGFKVYRGFVLFDTSSIGASSTVTQANLSMTLRDNTWDTLTVQIVKQNWTGTWTNETNREDDYDGCLAGTADDSVWKVFSGGYVANNTHYASGNLSTEWVSKTGMTKYSLRSNNDLAGTQPSGSESVYISSMQAETAGYRPKLIVTYTAGGALLKVNMNAQMSNLTGGIHG